MSTELTIHEERILRFLEAYLLQHHRAPSYAELCKAACIPSKDHISRDLRRLEQKGFIALVPRIARGVRLLFTAEGRLFNPFSLSVPLLGTIAAGEPIPVPEAGLAPDEHDTIELTRDIVGGFSNVYALRVKGDSMIDAFINDGDIVIMQHQPRVENGELAAVWLTENQETTLKRFYQEEGQVRLQPENRAMGPMFFPPERVQVQGKVIAVIRQT